MTVITRVELFAKWVTTLSDHPCDLCSRPIVKGARAHYVNSEALVRAGGGWQHGACWERFAAEGIAELPAPIELRIAAMVENSSSK